MNPSVGRIGPLAAGVPQRVLVFSLHLPTCSHLCGGYESCRGKQITLKLKSGLSKIGARGRRKEEQKFLPKHLDSSEMIYSFGQQVLRTYHMLKVGLGGQCRNVCCHDVGWGKQVLSERTVGMRQGKTHFRPERMGWDETWRRAPSKWGGNILGWETAQVKWRQGDKEVFLPSGSVSELVVR